MEIRSLFSKIFGENKPQAIEGATDFKLLSNFMPAFYNFSGDLYDSSTVRSCIHAIASNAAKLKPTHMYKDAKISGSNSYERLLSLRPNEYMNSYDFVYRIVSQLYSTNNAFVYIRTVNGAITGLYPINYSSIRLVEYQDETYAQFEFQNTYKVALPYSDLIHIRRHFNRNDMFGESAFEPLYPTLQTLSIIDQGIINAIKSSAFLRGILKYTGGILNSKDLKKAKDDFMTDYLNINNNNGIAALDSKAEYIPLDLKPQMADDKQMQIARDNIYRYFNVSEKIITSNYSENEYNAFYSSVIEPIAIQMSLEFTHKMFTDKEIGFGNKVVFSAERMTFANNQTKANIINILMPLGVLSANQAMQIMELPTVDEEWADEHIISLNYVDAVKKNEYQGVNNNEPKTDKSKTNQDS